MNSRQINFFIYPTELDKVFNYFSRNDIVIIKRRTTSPEIIPTMVRFDSNEILNKTGAQFYLTRKSDVENRSLRWNYLNEELGYSIDMFSSYCIEFSVGNIFSSALKSSRLYVIKKYFSDDEILIKKDDRFCKWADDVIKQFKKEFLRKQNILDILCTEEAMLWINQNNVLLSPDATELRSNKISPLSWKNQEGKS